MGGGVGGGRLVLSFVLVLGCANNKFVTSRFDSCVSQRAAPLVATKPQYGRRGKVGCWQKDGPQPQCQLTTGADSAQWCNGCKGVKSRKNVIKML